MLSKRNEFQTFISNLNLKNIVSVMVVSTLVAVNITCLDTLEIFRFLLFIKIITLQLPIALVFSMVAGGSLHATQTI